MSPVGTFGKPPSRALGRRLSSEYPLVRPIYYLLKALANTIYWEIYVASGLWLLVRLT